MCRTGMLLWSVHVDQPRVCWLCAVVLWQRCRSFPSHILPTSSATLLCPQAQLTLGPSMQPLQQKLHVGHKLLERFCHSSGLKSQTSLKRPQVSQTCLKLPSRSTKRSFNLNPSTKRSQNLLKQVSCNTACNVPSSRDSIQVRSVVMTSKQKCCLRSP